MISAHFASNFNSFLKPSPVPTPLWGGETGFLDDLIGQQIAIHFIILFTSISLLLLIITFIINNVLYLNKEFLFKHFSQNKFIQFYLKYQAFTIKLSLFILPIFIFIGLFTLIQSSHYLLTHPIPYEDLNVNLHVYVGRK